MKSIWVRLGQIAFWLAWPALFVYLRFTRRTRVLLVVGDEVLVVKGWLGSGHWNLPGGGIHLGESPEAAAVREVREEAGVQLKPQQLKPLLVKRKHRELGLTFGLHAFVVRLPHKPASKKQLLEITHLQWLPARELLEDRRTPHGLRLILDAWQNKG